MCQWCLSGVHVNTMLDMKDKWFELTAACVCQGDCLRYWSHLRSSPSHCFTTHRYHDTMTYQSQITLNSSLLSLTLTLSLPPTLSHSLPWSIIVFHKPASGKLQNCVRPEIRGIRVDQGREGEGRGSSGSLLCKCIYIDMSQRCANGGFTPP